MKSRFLPVTLLLILVVTLSCSRNPTVIKTCRIIAVDSASVWEQTKAHYRVDYDSSGAGIFVKSIDGAAQSRTAFWLYYVNGVPATVSCEESIPATGDTIEWRLQRSL